MRIMKVNFKNIFQFLIIIFFVFIFYSCVNKDKSKEINFITDSTKIGIETIDYDLGIKFNPPKEWELQPSSLSKKMESNSSGNFFYQPIYLFFDKNAKAILSVGKVQSTDTAITKSTQINYYKSLLTSKYKNNNLSYVSFTKDKIHFNKINFEKENLISLKVIFLNKEDDIIQFDFSFPKDKREELITLIQASIGTIETLRK